MHLQLFANVEKIVWVWVAMAVGVVLPACLVVNFVPRDCVVLPSCAGRSHGEDEASFESDAKHCDNLRARRSVRQPCESSVERKKG